MKSKSRITLVCNEKQNLNGLGMMILQYLDQNLTEFEDKVQEGLRIRGTFSVELEGGIASSIIFQGNQILIQNDVSSKPDLHLKGSYLLMSKVIVGQANPFIELLRKNIKLAAFPRRPIQSYRVLRFLKIPRKLLVDSKTSTRK